MIMRPFAVVTTTMVGGRVDGARHILDAPRPTGEWSTGTYSGRTSLSISIDLLQKLAQMECLDAPTVTLITGVFK